MCKSLKNVEAMPIENRSVKCGWSRKAGTAVRCRQLKLQFFYRGYVGTGCNRITCKHDFKFPHRRDFAKAMRLTDAQLKGTKNKPENLSDEAIQALQDYCCFDTNWVEWLNGTPYEFAEKYNKENTYQPDYSTVKKAATARQTGLRLRVARPFAPKAADAMLASVELNTSQSGPDDPWLLSADLISMPSPVEGMEIAIKRGQLEFDCAGAHSVELQHRAGFPSGLTIVRESDKIIMRPFGTSQKPGWDVQANGIIGALSLPHDLCPVQDVAAGEEIEVRFSAYVKDLELTEDEDNEPAGEGQPENESYSFIRPGMKKLGAAKEKILKRMAEMRLPGGAEGWSVLCQDARRFDAADEDR